MDTHYEAADRLIREVTQLASKLEDEGDEEALRYLKTRCQNLSMRIEQKHLRSVIASLSH